MSLLSLFIVIICYCESFSQNFSLKTWGYRLAFSRVKVLFLKLSFVRDLRVEALDERLNTGALLLLKNGGGTNSGIMQTLRKNPR